MYGPTFVDFLNAEVGQPQNCTFTQTTYSGLEQVDQAVQGHSVDFLFISGSVHSCMEVRSVHELCRAK